ncbi:MAG: hypothetical protein JEZ06_14920 [Anaerolineaceae bacterium]|nr:hypothetical protein [Anaerolineaceae bacterium]
MVVLLILILNRVNNMDAICINGQAAAIGAVLNGSSPRPDNKAQVNVI